MFLTRFLTFFMVFFLASFLAFGAWFFSALDFSGRGGCWQLGPLKLNFGEKGIVPPHLPGLRLKHNKIIPASSFQDHMETPNCFRNWWSKHAKWWQKKIQCGRSIYPSKHSISLKFWGSFSTTVIHVSVTGKWSSWNWTQKSRESRGEVLF